MHDPFGPAADGLPPAKYWGEQSQQRHPGTLQWPGAHGLPFLGPPGILLKPEERNNLPIVSYFYARTFDMDDPDDAEYYKWVMDHAAHSMFAIEHVSRNPVEYEADGQKRIKMFVYVEWRQLYATLGGRGGNTNADPTNYVMGS